MSNNKLSSIGEDELLEELTQRVKEKKISCQINYFYDIERMQMTLEGKEFGLKLYRDWDIKASARYRQNYELCLPLINQFNEKKQNKQLEILKTKIN